MIDLIVRLAPVETEGYLLGSRLPETFIFLLIAAGLGFGGQLLLDARQGGVPNSELEDLPWGILLVPVLVFLTLGSSRERQEILGRGIAIWPSASDANAELRAREGVRIVTKLAKLPGSDLPRLCRPRARPSMSS